MPGRAVAALPNGGWGAAWSPDSTRIAFLSGSPHSIPNLWVIGSDKKGLRQMTTRGAHEPQWLPDGKTIVFGTLRSGESAFMRIDAAGAPGSEKPVEALPRGAVGPVWSPDGSLVTYGVVAKDGSSIDVGYARTNGGGATGLTSKFWCRDWTWSPDGGTIAFVVGKSAGTSVWTADIATKDVKLLYKGFCGSPVYSPDGKSLAIAVPDIRSGFKIVVVDLKAKAEKSIAVTTFDGGKVMWSPDASHLFFASNRKSEPAVWSVGADGKGLTRLTTKATPASEPALSPNGKSIAFEVTTPTSYSPEMYTCSNTGQSLTKLTDSSSPSYWSPIWSPNGKEFAFTSDVLHSVSLYTGSPAGRTSKALTKIEGRDIPDASWSADGKALMLSDGGRLLKVDPSGGKVPVTPLAKVTNPVQGVRWNGNEMIVTEWVGRDALVSALHPDGSKKRTVTTKAVAPPKADSGKAPAPPHVVAGAATETNAEAGNPHADLGLMGPQVNVAKPPVPTTVDLWPAASPDGKSVAFVRDNQIWLVNSDGSKLRQLTSAASDAAGARTVANPTWSPDGKTILFWAYNNVPGKVSLDIWLCGLVPGSERSVYSEAVNTEFGVYYADCTNPPAFTPDGKRILFTSVANGEPRIVSIAADGSDLREVVQAPSSFPALDATGSRMAFVDLSNFHERICVRDMKTGKVQGPLFKK
ncbi:MAG TPA: hypothetical protein VGM51_15095 [Armatimonadota bacterium]|jgi:TolB protein